MHVWLWGSTQSFQPYSVKHLIVLAALGVACAGVVGLRRFSLRDRKPYEPVLGVVLLLIWMAGTMFKWLAPNASTANTLPLHWCDLTGILAGVVLLNPTRETRAALHFWGICFSSLAFLMPIEKRGPAELGFWMYFVPHGAIVLAVVYDRVVNEYTPTWRDFGVVALATLCWGAAITPFNLLLDANYSYIGNTLHHQRSIVLLFGDWPGRLVWMYAAALVLMSAVMLAQRLGRSAVRVPTDLPDAAPLSVGTPLRRAA